MNLTDEAVKALLSGATPGPWTVETGNVPIADTGDYAGYCRLMAGKRVVFEQWDDEEQSEKDAALAAAAPDLAHALLDARAELARLNGQVAGLRTETDAYRMCVNCGLIVPSTHDRAQSGPGCESPDACTFDLTPREAWEYWRARAHECRADAAAAVALVVERAAEGLVNAFLHMRATYANEISALTPFDPLQAFYEKEVVWSAIGDAQVAIRALSSVGGLALVAELRADVQGWASNATEAWRLMREAEAERDTLAAEVASLKDQVAVLVGAVIWCSGSNDFQEGGVAREGWLKLCAPLIQPAADDDPPCTDCDDTGITHQTEQFCSCDAGRNALAQAQPAAEEGK